MENKNTFSRSNWSVLLIFGLIGQIAWSVENMYFNLFVFETISPDLMEIMPGVISGFLMSFTYSLDDFIISYFTTGATSQTLPITIYSMTRRKISPEINALSTIIFVVVVIVLIVKNIIENRQYKNKMKGNADY